MASITIPGRIKSQTYHLAHVEQHKQVNTGGLLGITMTFAEYGTGKEVVVELGSEEADRLVNWQDYAEPIKAGAA